MPKLRRLSGHEVVAILTPFGFLVVAQRGSHMKLKRMGQEGAQVLTIPAHTSLDVGTLRAILRQASRFIPEEQLHPHFYHP
jgi:predicted RNA binding protein YcfA (HicA-like mRNA interferase family)